MNQPHRLNPLPKTHFSKRKKENNIALYDDPATQGFLARIKEEIELLAPAQNADSLLVREAISTRARAGFSAGYHFEFVFVNESEASFFCEVLAQYEIFPKMLAEDGHFRVYIKSSECICNLLALAGANKSLLDLNNEIALRSLRNVSNRRTNCDIANTAKQIATAQKQIDAIRKLPEIPPELVAVADARLRNPTASYDELANLLGLTKSAVVRKIKKLVSGNL